MRQNFISRETLSADLTTFAVPARPQRLEGTWLPPLRRDEGEEEAKEDVLITEILISLPVLVRGAASAAPSSRDRQPSNLGTTSSSTNSKVG
jgi:hypothetical protein